KGDRGCLVRGILDESERGLAFAGGIHEGDHDLPVPLNMQRLWMTRICETHQACPPICREVKGGRQEWRSAVLENRMQITVKFREEHPRVAGHRFELLYERTDHCGHKG